MPPLAFSALFVLLSALYLATLAPTVTTRNGGVDGGELVAAAASVAVPHPPGYPTYLVLARLALQLPTGEPAWRVGVLSALSMAGAATLVAMTTYGLLGGAGAPALVASLCAGLLLGLDALAWSQATIPEVYAPALLALALLVWLAARWRARQRNATAAAAGLVLGLGYGLHATLLAVTPAALIALLVLRRRPGWRAFALAGLLALLGLSLFALLPLVQARGGGWGDTSTPRGLLDHVLARQYRDLVGATSWAERLGRLSLSATSLLAGQGPWGLLAGCWGLATLRARPALLAFSGTIALTSLAWSATYGGDNSAVGLLPLHLCWALWAGLGLGERAAWLAPRQSWLLPAALLLPLLLLPLRLPELSLHGATETRVQAELQLQQLPTGAILLTARDEETFPLWYLQRALGQRDDVQVVDLRLWSHAWYRARLGVTEELELERWLAGRTAPLYASASAAASTAGPWLPAGPLFRRP